MRQFDERKIRSWSLILSLGGLLIVLGGWALAEHRPPEKAAEQGPAALVSGAQAPEVLGVVGGEEITEKDVEEAVSAQLEEIKRQRHALLEQGLAQLVSAKLIALEARAQGLSSEELLAREVEGKVSDPTDADVDAFYTQNQARIRQPKEQVADQIRGYLRGRGEQQAREELEKRLREKYAVRTYFEPLRVEVASEGFPAYGPQDAPVTIVEFSDFQCPYCSRVNPTLAQVKQNYGGKIRLVFRQFPLPIHSDAQKAAEASLCAYEQGKFWEMHDAMFASQRQLGVDQLKAKAAELGLDAEAFGACLDGGEYADEVAKDLAAGQEAGVTGTPAMFVNGRFINGAVPYEDIARVIDDELSREGTPE